MKWFREHRTALFQAVGYLTATVILLTVFLYLTFPWEKLSRYVEVRIEEATASNIEVERSEIRFPFRMIWTGVKFRSKRVNKPIEIDLDRISMEWTLRRLLQRRVELLWSVRVAEGEGRGRILAQPTPQGMQYRVTADSSGMQLDRLIGYFAPDLHGIKGTLRITQLQHDWVGMNPLKGTGTANLELSDSHFEIQNPMAGKVDLGFNRVTAILSMKAGVAQLEDFLAQGPDMDITGSGNVLIRPFLQNSLVNFTSRATIRNPEGPFSLLMGSSGKPGGGTDLMLRGTIRQPKLFVNGVYVLTLT